MEASAPFWSTALVGSRKSGVMLPKEFFIRQAIRGVEIEKFLKEYFPVGDYSHIELQRTPLGVKIIIWTNKPGRIIGRGGKTISDITETLKERFRFENPQLDVKMIENPDLDACIVAKQIASALEKGYNYKKIGNMAIRRVMDAGAAGVEIVISGKLGGAKAMTSKFIEGHIETSGHPQTRFVNVGFEEANTKPGKIGILVRIMTDYQTITGQIVRPERKKTELKDSKIEGLAEEAVEEEAIKTEQMPKPEKAEETTEGQKPKSGKAKTKTKAKTIQKGSQKRD